MKKIVSLLLTISFSFFNTAYSVETADVAKAGQDQFVANPLVVDEIGVDIDAGTIKSKFAGASGKTIIHIQDAHCNYEAQSNINRMLDQFTKELGVNMISVEGAEGIVDTSWFKAFPDEEIRKEVADYFMKKGEITGAEFFSITTDYNGTIFGAEDRDKYIKNLKAFTNTYPYKDQIENYFKNALSVTTRLKDIVYNEPLKALDAKIRAFEAKEIELSEFAAFLNNDMKKYKVSIKTYTNFEKLVSTLDYESKIDFDVVDTERGDYIDVLGKKMGKKEMANLVAYSVKFKKGHIKAVDFYSYLRDQATVYNIDMYNDFPNLFYYYIYTKLYEGIDNEALFKEIDSIKVVLKDKLFKNDTERKLDRYSLIMDMYIKLVDIELTNDDYDIFKEYTKDTKIEDITAFLGSLSAKYNLNYSVSDTPKEILDNMPNMIDFYEVAIVRDKALIENTLNQMSAENKNTSVLITGGFHTKGIRKLLEEKGISYVVVMPKITKDVETPYLQVLTNQRTSIEDILTGNAMPRATTTSMTGKEGQDSELSPLLRVALVTDLFEERNQEVQELSRQIGKISDSSVTLEEAVSSQLEETITQLTTRWLNKVKAQMVETLGTPAARDEWNRFVQDNALWNMLLASYFNKMRDEGLDSLLIARINELITVKFNVFRKAETESAGIQAVGVVLDSTQAERFNEVLRESFTSGTFYYVELGFIRRGFRIVVHEGLNDRLIQAGLPLNIHPGRGGEDFNRGLLQVHIDKEVYESVLNGKNKYIAVSDVPEDIMILARHELKHLDIANAEATAIETRRVNTGLSKKEIEQKVERAIKTRLGDEAFGTWYNWVFAGRPKGEAQERFVNFETKSNTSEIADRINGFLISKFGPQITTTLVNVAQLGTTTVMPTPGTSPGPQLAITPGYYTASRTDGISVSGVNPETLAFLAYIGGILNQGRLLEIRPFFTTGVGGYTWGVPFTKSYNMGLIASQVEGVDISDVVSRETGVPLDTVVAERWIGAGKLRNPGQPSVGLPVAALSLFREQVFGRQHVEELGAVNPITSKILESARPLSFQIHDFPEVVIPLQDGFAFLGLSRYLSVNEFIAALEKGDTSIFNRVELKKGVPVVVPPGLPHAYGKVLVYEVKAVSAEEDKAGTISFFDRLKLTAEQSERVSEIVRTIPDFETRKEALIREGLIEEKRAVKDILTIPRERAIEIAKKIERAGFLKGVNISEVVSSEVIDITPQGIEGAKIEEFARTDRFKAFQITVNEGVSIQNPSEVTARFHTLIVTEGTVDITNAKGEVIDTIKKGEERIVPANIGEYSIRSKEGEAVIFTQVSTLSKAESPTIRVDLTNERRDTPITFTEIPGTGRVPSFSPSVVVDKTSLVVREGLTINASEPGVTPSGIINIRSSEGDAPRTTRLIVNDGTIRILVNDENPLIFNGDEATFVKGAIIEITPNGISDNLGRTFNVELGVSKYTIVKVGELPSSVDVTYTKLPAERAIYNVFEALERHKTTILEKPVTLIIPKGAANAQTEETRLENIFPAKGIIDVVGYNEGTSEGSGLEIGEIVTAIRNSITSGRVPVLIVTKSDIQALSKNIKGDKELESALASVRILTIPEIDDNVVYFMPEIEGTAILQAALTIADIKDEPSSLANDMKLLLNQFNGTEAEITKDTLYFMLPLTDIQKVYLDISESIAKYFEEGVIPTNLTDWISGLINNLLIKMPIKPYDPTQRLEERRKVMWSV